MYASLVERCRKNNEFHENHSISIKFGSCTAILTRVITYYIPGYRTLVHVLNFSMRI